MSRIYYCTAVCNRWDTFKLLLNSFLRLPDKRAQLNVYDWNGAGKDIYSTWPDTVCYQAGEDYGPINRATARNRSFALAESPADSDLVFFVDCDMVLPADFSARIRTHVKPGHAYFPVCYSLYRDSPLEVRGEGPPHHKNGSSAYGWWRDAGRGNCGFTVGDFKAIGDWDGARFGTRYGREDDDIYWRAFSQCAPFRERVPGFFHQWHPRPQEEQNPSVRRDL